MQIKLKTKIGSLGPLIWLILIPEVRDVSMEKVHFTMLTSRSVLTLTSATKVNQLTFSTWLVLNTMRQDLCWGSRACKWETRSEKTIFTSQTSGFDRKWSPLLQQNGGAQALLSTSTPRSINVTNVPYPFWIHFTPEKNP